MIHYDNNNNYYSVSNNTLYVTAGEEGNGITQDCSTLDNIISVLDIEDTIISVIFDNTITAIGAFFMYDNTSLTSVTISNSITQIGKGAFQYCSSLITINIPSSVISIGNYAFRSCSNLITVYVNSNTPASLGSSVFSGLPSNFIIYIPSGTLSSYSTATRWSNYASHLQEISETVTTIKININGTWKQGIPYVNVGGTWKQGTAYIKVNGEWKKGT